MFDQLSVAVVYNAPYVYAADAWLMLSFTLFVMVFQLFAAVVYTFGYV